MVLNTAAIELGLEVSRSRTRCCFKKRAGGLSFNLDLSNMKVIFIISMLITMANTVYTQDLVLIDKGLDKFQLGETIREENRQLLIRHQQPRFDEPY